MIRIAFMMSAALFLQACTYAISSDLVKQADTNLPFEQLETDPDSYKGKLVILGGTIAKTVNTQQSTQIEVVRKPLDVWGKPLATKQPAGRFIVRYAGYLDELVFVPGRSITVAGVVQGGRPEQFNDVKYTYPVILSKELKLWPDERPALNRPEYLDPLYDSHTLQSK